MVPGETYHLYNHANGKENLFIEEKNYRFFLSKLSEQILPVCKIYAYCLMPNHYHLLIQVRTAEQLQQLCQSSETLPKFGQKQVENKVSKGFSNFFSSYTQAFNKVYKRKGSLFIPSMKMHKVNGDISFCKVVHYIHANPVHHGFVKKLADWHHSSFKIFLSENPTKLERNYVLKVFGGREAFIKYQQQPIDLKIKFLEKNLSQIQTLAKCKTLAKLKKVL